MAKEERRISPVMLILPIAGVIGLGAIGTILFAFSRASAAPEEEPPPEGAARIIGSSWELIDYPFTDYWGETLTATFVKGTLQVESPSEFIGNIRLASPNVIAPVRLLTEYGYQQLLAEIDGLIANTSGAIKELWQARKAIALNFPTADNFTIDYRWSGDWGAKFRSWIDASTDTLILEDVPIPEGISTIKIAFFNRYGAALGINPVIISLYSDNTLLDSVESEIVPPAGVPQLLSVNIPSPVPSGGDILATAMIRLPVLLGSNQYYGFRLQLERIDIAEAGYMSQSIVETLLARGCAHSYLALDAPDDIYTVAGIWESGEWLPGKLVSRRGDPIPPGVYDVTAGGTSWKVSGKSSGCGTLWYGTGPVATYNFGVVGQLVVT